MVSDQIGDFIIQIKNAGNAGIEAISVPYSKFKFNVAEKLKDVNYIKSVSKKIKKVKKYLEVELKYNDANKKKPRIHNVVRVSKPSRRIYKKTSEIFPIKYGKGTLILSTPKGVLTGEEARKQKIGGEVLFKIW